MTVSYLDTSAAMKLVVEEAESERLAIELSADPGRRLVSSWLLHTELLCAVGRHPRRMSEAAVLAVLDAVTLVDVTRGDLVAAGAQAPLRSLDAIHLAAAVRVGAEELVAYDAELMDAARARGLRIVAPR